MRSPQATGGSKSHHLIQKLVSDHGTSLNPVHTKKYPLVPWADLGIKVLLTRVGIFYGPTPYDDYPIHSTPDNQLATCL